MSKNRNPSIRQDTSSKGRFTKKKEKSRPGVGIYNGIPYESFNEYYFLLWVEDLKKGGYIKSLERAPSYILTEGYSNIYTEQTKRQSSGKSKSQQLLRPSVYTPEFVITWDDHLYKHLVWILNSGTRFAKTLVGAKTEGGIKTWIEVKGAFDFQNMSRLFINNQKFIFKTHNIFVNLVKIPDLFEKTFTPLEYLKTSTGKPRKIKFEVRTLNQFLTNV